MYFSFFGNEFKESDVKNLTNSIKRKFLTGKNFYFPSDMDDTYSHKYLDYFRPLIYILFYINYLLFMHVSYLNRAGFILVFFSCFIYI
jgi:hypothetical protein